MVLVPSTRPETALGARAPTPKSKSESTLETTLVATEGTAATTPAAKVGKAASSSATLTSPAPVELEEETTLVTGAYSVTASVVMGTVSSQRRTICAHSGR